LSLDAVLQKIVDVAREHSAARYAALSVIGHNGQIERFLTSGISDVDREAIGELPRGRGLLGLLLKKGETLRVDDLSLDPRAYGFPPNHPPMRSLLGVPMVWAGQIIGNLYLTDRDGGQPFDDRDEEIVRLLASHAAVAIRNARVYEAEQRRAEEWKALFDLGQQVTASPNLQHLLHAVVQRARQLIDTDVAVLLLLSSDGASLRLMAGEGLQTRGLTQLNLATEAGLMRLALEDMAPVVITNFFEDPRLEGRAARLAELEGLEALIIVPLRSGHSVLGVLAVANRRPTQFTIDQSELLQSFANWTAVAIESSRLYDQLESVARLEERERIGMDLHDGVMQSIYAVGLQLEDCVERLESSPQDARAGIERAIDSLGNVIKDIRSYIFDLRPRLSVVADLPDAIRQLVDDVRVNTLMQTSLDLEGSVKGLIDQSQALALFHIAQEALNNVSKHSQATSVLVRLSANPREVVVEVTDNGVGIDPARADDYQRQGLRNMRDRARSIGASLAFDSTPGSGTTVRVTLPVTQEGIG
jgi:signal transduction histidine kinase